MFPLEKEAVVLDACVLFPMLVRDVLLSLADAEFFAPRWSAKIRDEWTRNLAEQWAKKMGQKVAQKKVDAIADSIDEAFPGAYVEHEVGDDGRLLPVDKKDRHVVMTALVGHCHTLVTFNLKDFARDHVFEHFGIRVVHPDDLVRDCIDENPIHVAVTFQALLGRKIKPKWTYDDLLERLIRGDLKATAEWLSSPDIRQLVDRPG